MQANWSSIYNDDSCWIYPYSFSAEDEERKKEKKKGDIISLDHLGRRTWLAMHNL